MRYQVVTDGLTFTPCFDRRYAVLDTARRADNHFGHPWVLQTDDGQRAVDYAFELNKTEGKR